MGNGLARCAIVVPCYNEEHRLAISELSHLLGEGAHLVLVDDGSRDRTGELLEEMRCRFPERVSVLSRPVNGGKGSAVLDGLRTASELGRDFVGYYDADGATPAVAVVDLASAATDPDVSVVLGARVLLLGRDIERRPIRHYLGRVFAAAASRVLRVAVYDTQCGAKLFRVSPEFRAALDEPFCGRWAFDVELLGRLLTGSEDTSPIPASAFIEVPLHAWRDVAGSRMSPLDAVEAGVDLLHTWTNLRSRRKLGGTG